MKTRLPTTRPSPDSPGAGTGQDIIFKRKDFAPPMLRIWSWITIVMGVLMGLSPEFGIATWLIYGLMKRDLVLIVSNGIGVVVGLVYLLTIRYYSS